MTNFTYVREVPLMKKIFSILLVLAGIGILIWISIFFGIMIFFIGVNMLLTEGTEINLESKTYRSIKSILGLHFGKWKPCPEFEYVSVFKTKEATAVSAYGAEIATFKNDVIMLNLFSKGNKHFTVYKTDDKTEAFKVAEHFKLALEIDILDATQKESVWL